jgi:hypothetical protein
MNVEFLGNGYFWLAGLIHTAASVLVVLGLMRHRERFILLPYAIAFIWVGFSVLYIESGIFIVEQRQYSYPNGATLAHVAVYGAFWLPAAFAVGLVTRTTPRLAAHLAFDREARSFLWLGAIALGLLLANAAASPLPLFDPRIDRFDYWSHSRFPMLQGLLGNTATILATIFGLVALRARLADRKILGRWIRVLAISYFVYLMLIGHAFSAISLGLIAYYIPAAVAGPSTVNWRGHIRTIVVVALIAMAILGLKAYQYGVRFNPYASTLGLDATQAILYRALGLQGHLWWGVVDARGFGGVLPTWQWSELGDGLIVLMKQFGHRIGDQSISRGVTFTNGYPGILVHVLPWWAVLPLQCAAGLLMGALGGMIVRWMRAGETARPILLFQVFIWLQYTFTMGAFDRFLRPTLWVLVILLVAYSLLRRLAASPARYPAVAVNSSP